MEIIIILFIALGGFLISWRIEKKRKARLQRLMHLSKVTAHRAENLSSVLDDEFQSAIRAIEMRIRLLKPDRPSFVQILERVVYTKQSIKIFYDPNSNIPMTFTGKRKVIGVGVEVDPNEFRALLKEKERNKLISEFSESMRKIK